MLFRFIIFGVLSCYRHRVSFVKGKERRHTQNQLYFPHFLLNIGTSSYPRMKRMPAFQQGISTWGLKWGVLSTDCKDETDLIFLCHGMKKVSSRNSREFAANNRLCALCPLGEPTPFTLRSTIFSRLRECFHSVSSRYTEIDLNSSQPATHKWQGSIA